MSSDSEFRTSEHDFKIFIITLTQRLLKAIDLNDYPTYAQLTDPNLTCFEPGSLGNLVPGIEFHKFFLENSKSLNIRSILLNPVVHMLSPESACIAYNRLVEYIDGDGNGQTGASVETRVWYKSDNKWKVIHFHLNLVPNSS